MGVKIPTYITEFDNGMTTNPRNQTPGIARIIKHFDNYSDPQKLIPYRSQKLDAVAGNEDSLDIFRITKQIATPLGLYGFGQVSDLDAHACVYTKTTPTDPTAVWTTAPGTNHDGSGLGGSRVDASFDYYMDYIFGGSTGNIWKYGPLSGSPAFVYNDFGHQPTAKALIHSKSGLYYVPSNNLLLLNDMVTGAGWSIALTLPTGTVIKSLCEDGNYLVIACDLPDGTMVSFIWDQDSTLTTITDKIDWGIGSTQLIENIGGIIVCIIKTSVNATSIEPKVMFKYWTGSEVKIFETWDCTLANFTGDKQKFNDLFYFLAEINMNGEVLKGTWKIFKKLNGQLSVSFDRLPRNDTALADGSLKGFYRWGDYVFISYLTPANGKYTIWRTDDQANYLATSVFETVKYNQVLGLRNKHIPDSSMVKKLIGVTLNSEPITSGESGSVGYRIEGETSWTSIFTHSTVGDITHSAINIEASNPNVNLRQHKEIEFQLLSTGGLEITGFGFENEVIGKRKY